METIILRKEPALVIELFDDSFKIIINRLIPKNIDPEEKLNKKHHFNLQTVDNIDEELSKMDVFF